MRWRTALIGTQHSIPTWPRWIFKMTARRRSPYSWHRSVNLQMISWAPLRKPNQILMTGLLGDHLLQKLKIFQSLTLIRIQKGFPQNEQELIKVSLPANLKYAGFVLAKQKKKTPWSNHVNAPGQWDRSTSSVWRSGSTLKRLSIPATKYSPIFGKLWSVNYARSHLNERWGLLCSISWSLTFPKIRAGMTQTAAAITWSWSPSTACQLRLCMCST